MFPDRITHKDVSHMFKLYVERLGGRLATFHGDVGAYRLDYVREYGGFSIEQIWNENGAVCHPLGAGRRGTREMFNTLCFGLQMLAHLEDNKRKKANA